MAKVKAGSLCKYRTSDQPDYEGDKVGLVLEVASNEYDDGTSEEFAVIAPLSTIHVKADGVVPLNEQVAPPPPPPTLTSDVAGELAQEGAY